MDSARKCKAHTSSGVACKNWAIKGGAVCAHHGGAAPQVKQAAEARLAALVDPAITRLTRIVTSTDSDAVALAAVKDILDRAGYKRVEEIKVSTDITMRDLRQALGVNDD
jgi:regulator of extracellular matrix RemA (YlzA/DUF370 family)